jgi:MerR family copper efflux transcriptional regulator
VSVQQLFEEKIAFLDARIGQMHTLRSLLAERAMQVCPLAGIGH